jgi:hypothetical protein
MDKEPDLMQKRREAQQEILALKEKIPSALILNRLGRPFKSRNLGYWLLSIILLNLILAVPWVILGLALNELGKSVRFFASCVVNLEITVVGFVVAHIVAQYILDNIAHRITEKINNVDDLSKMLLWFKQTWSIQNISAFAVPFCIVWLSLGVGSMSISSHEFVGFGLSLTSVLTGLLASLGFYVPFWICLLIFNLKDYQYEMNVFSPADSEIISDISETLTTCLYALAVLFAVITFFATSSLIDPQLLLTFSLPVVVIYWGIVVVLYLLIRSTLGAIVDKAKWKTLNKLQTQINSIEATGDLSEKETAERLLRLADIYKQIMASKTNTFDLKSVSTLFSQMMLPLLGLLLGNLDKLLKLLP